MRKKRREVTVPLLLTALACNNHKPQSMMKKMIFLLLRKNLKREMEKAIMAMGEELLLRARRTKLILVVRLLITPILRN